MCLHSCCLAKKGGNYFTEVCLATVGGIHILVQARRPLGSSYCSYCKIGFSAIGSFPRCTSVRDMHEDLQIPYVYDYITKSCRQQPEVIQNHVNEMFATLNKAKPDTEHVRDLNVAAVMCTTLQVSRLPW
jgi:hypothetical protein